jgi:hypothetical protein
MILWCKLCGAFMGVREPLTDWSTDRQAICAICSENQLGIDRDAAQTKDAERQTPGPPEGKAM